MDATALTSAAATVEGHAEVLIARARLVAHQCDAMRWNSLAARRCRSVIDALCSQLLASGSAAAALADRMRACAVRVGNAR